MKAKYLKSFRKTHNTLKKRLKTVGFQVKIVHYKPDEKDIHIDFSSPKTVLIAIN
jgi:hypothetical protein